MKIILLVTWIVSGAQPNSYQVAYTSAQACEAARYSVLAERERIMKDFANRDEIRDRLLFPAIDRTYSSMPGLESSRARLKRRRRVVSDGAGGVIVDIGITQFNRGSPRGSFRRSGDSGGNRLRGVLVTTARSTQ